MVLIIFIRVEAWGILTIKLQKAVRISIDDSRFIAEVADLNGLQPFLATILFIDAPLCLRRSIVSRFPFSEISLLNCVEKKKSLCLQIARLERLELKRLEIFS